MEEVEWPAIGVMGAGAVGCYFGGMLARAGAPVTLVGRLTHVEAINRNGLYVDSLQFREHIAVTASTKIEALHHAEIVLFCVKTLDTEAAARALLPFLARGASVVSLQNGVDNVERIRSATSLEAIAAAVYVGAEMTGPGCVKHTARGDLIFGDLSRGASGDDARRHQPGRLVELFARAGVPSRATDSIEAELWTKLIINCAYNAISALARARYGRIARNPWTHDLMRQVVEECVAVARAAGVRLGDVDLVQAAWKLAASMPGTISSTAQDIIRGKQTEIDSLNGYVARRGAALGVAAPVNQTLHALVKLLEEPATDSPVAGRSE